MSHLMNTYARLPVSFVRGEGVWLWDGQGKRYLDAVAGLAVNTLGHAHPRLIKALSEQVGTLIHTSNLYQVQKQEELAAKLAGLANMDKVFFCTSGAEANEAAIKLARLYGHQKSIDNPTIIVMEKSFHGRTMATLSATGSRRVQAGFEPLMGGFARVTYNDVDAVAQVAGHNKNIVAVLVEPIQGEAGIRVPLPLPDYFHGLRRICDEQGWLLMLDEVQSGIGRTGKWFAHQHSGIKPDVMTLAKGLGSGVPIGACLAAGAAAEAFKPGSHGSTFGGSPLACVAALTTLAVIEEEKLMPHAVKLGEFIRNGLAQALAGVKEVVQIRGEGLMMGVELAQPCGDIAELALEQGLLINVTAENVIRLLPALVMRQAEAQLLVDGLSGLIRDFSRQAASASARA
ncbi:MAG TPA: aspartate aminotransferase family protein [Burkholderiales bacterium]|nr:aspartate aminotransferase family protein [Burkholderiales bacterium]